MRNLLFLAFGLLFSISYAQRHEIGVFIGGSNVIGDIGKSNYINPTPVSYFTDERIGRVPFALLLPSNIEERASLPTNITLLKVH